MGAGPAGQDGGGQRELKKLSLKLRMNKNTKTK